MFFIFGDQPYRRYGWELDTSVGVLDLRLLFSQYWYHRIFVTLPRPAFLAYLPIACCAVRI